MSHARGVSTGGGPTVAAVLSNGGAGLPLRVPRECHVSSRRMAGPNDRTCNVRESEWRVTKSARCSTGRCFCRI
jgi:hypothetical protein